MQSKPSRIEVGLHGGELQRREGSPTALGLRAAPEALDDGDGLVASDGAPAGLDVVTLAPGSIIRLELDSSVSDEVLRRPTCLLDGSLQEATDVAGARLLLEGLELDGNSRVLIDDAHDPVGEGPTEPDAERKPRQPESERGRHDGQVAVPDVSGVPRGNALRRGALRRWVRGVDERIRVAAPFGLSRVPLFGLRQRLERHPPDRRSRQHKPLPPSVSARRCRPIQGTVCFRLRTSSRT